MMTLADACQAIVPPPEPRCPDPFATVDCFACPGGRGWVVEANGPDTRRATCERCSGAGTEVCYHCGPAREAVCVCLLRDTPPESLDTDPPTTAPGVALCWACFVEALRADDLVRVVQGNAARTFAMRDAMAIEQGE